MAKKILRKNNKIKFPKRTLQVLNFLSENLGKFTYGQIAEELGTHAHAIGACMACLGRKGLHQYCSRVTFK